MAYSHAFFFLKPAVELFKSIVEHNKQKHFRRFMHSAEIDTRWGKLLTFVPSSSKIMIDGGKKKREIPSTVLHCAYCAFSHPLKGTSTKAK